MNPSFQKVISLLVFNLIISFTVNAKTVEQKELNFPIKTEDLLKGDIHYFFTAISPRKLVVTYPEIFDLDSLSLIQESNVTLLISKAVSIASKPVGFFEEEQMTDKKFVTKVMGDQKIQEVSPKVFIVTIPGEKPMKYKMQTYFDADDLSTLPNSKVIRAVGAAKKLDVISQGASTIMFKEMSQFNRDIFGGVSVSSYVPLKENKTLIISYSLWAVKNPVKDKNALKENFVEEIEVVNKIIDSYK